MVKFYKHCFPAHIEPRFLFINISCVHALLLCSLFAFFVIVSARDAVEKPPHVVHNIVDKHPWLSTKLIGIVLFIPKPITKERSFCVYNLLDIHNILAGFGRGAYLVGYFFYPMHDCSMVSSSQKISDRYVGRFS